MELRSDVRLEDGSRSALIVDGATGLRLSVSRDAAQILRSLDRVAGNVGEDLAAFLTEIDRLGLLEPTPREQAERAQGSYVWEAARRRESGRVRATIERAARTTALHRDHLNQCAASGDEWRLDTLPLLHKEDIRRHFPSGLISSDLDLPALLESGDLVLASTSGTTGERLQTFSDTRLRRLPPNVSQFWQLGASSNDRPLRTVVFTSPSCAGSACTRTHKEMKTRIVRNNTLFLHSPRNPFHITETETLQAIEEMRAFQADLLMANPVYLASLVERASEHGHVLPPVRAVLVSYQFLSHCQRRTIQRHIRAPLFVLYTATELGGSQIGVTCPQGRLHIRLDHVFLELTSKGRDVPLGDVGLVTVTSHSESMPLVRYALGDLARSIRQPCRCIYGSQWPVFSLEGRERDAFVIGGGYVTTRDVDEALRDIDLKSYQLRETAPCEYELDALPQPDARTWKSQASAALGDLLRPKRLSLREVSDLAPDESQKVRFTIPLGERQRRMSFGKD